MDLIDGLLLALGAVNFGLCLYLVWLFGRIREGLAQAEEVGAAAERTDSASELIARVAAEIERVAEEVSSDFEESDGRLTALERLIEEHLAAERRPSPDGAPAAADGASGEPDDDVPEDAAADAGAAAETRRDALGERGRRVRELRAKGKSLEVIARDLGLSGGEVECILGLADRLDAAPADEAVGRG